MKLSKEALAGMNKITVDLLVIGAGATGASVAYEAMKRGLKVGLVDAGDIGSGTSSRSTKLLHGGVRYLELAFKTLDVSQLKLVREALLERGFWLNEAPFLARSIELALPTSNCFNKAYYGVGLKAYDMLAGSSNIGASRLLSKEELNKAIPLLRGSIDGGVAYKDGQFDDARLNLLLALTSEREGTYIKTYSEVLEFKYRENGQVCGAISQGIDGSQQSWEFKAIVNATGIGSDKIRHLADPNVEPRILISRGTHLVVEENLCPEGIGLLIPSTDDGRVLFVLPFFGRTQIGTTDIRCNIHEANSPSTNEEAYLIRHIKSWFPNLREPTISSQWSGGRPLLMPCKHDMNSSDVVREHEIEVLPCGLISAMGGKWTTSRKIALDTLQAVERVLDIKLSHKKRIPLMGCKSNSHQTRLTLLKEREELSRCLPDSMCKQQQVEHLQSNFGLEALSVILKAPIVKREPLSQVIPVCIAEIEHAIDNEHACTTTDILARRNRLAMIDINEAERIIPIVQQKLEERNLPKSNLDLSK